MKANQSVLWFGSWPGSPGAFWGKARKRGQGEAERDREGNLAFTRQGVLCVPVRVRTADSFLE